MGNLPDGVLTFLFSDIESSTRLWEQRPDAMRLALAAHDRRVAEAVSAAGGHVVKSTGDGFMAVFAHPAGAVAAAVAVSRWLAQFDGGWLRARLGIHTGESSHRDGDYFGTEVNRAARLMDAANGGQIVVSEVTRTLVGSALPDGVALIEAGRHRLKDLSEPVAIHQLLGDGFDDRRALRTLDTDLNNLPVQLTSFVGREEEIAELQDVVASARLTTLTGLGGLGKTRLALQVGAELAHRIPDGVWFLALDELATPELIAPTALSMLGIQPDPLRSTDQQLIDELANRVVLLILDNCEHLVDDVARLVDRLLRAAPHVTVLATSREGLAVPGEHLWPVPPLPVGTDGPALSLFEERAQLVRPAFAVDADNREAVADLCERLDGIPLAIELATARLSMMDLYQIGERLGERFRLLTSSSRTAATRQRTLEATLDWSYELLTSEEQTLLRRVSVFVGGFDLDAAEQVTSGEALPIEMVLELLGRLVQTSLVTFEQAPTPRYRLLETVREYAVRKLSEADELNDAKSRHAEHYAAVAKEFEAASLGPDAARVVTDGGREMPNLRAAINWAHATGRHDLGLAISVAAYPVARAIGADVEIFEYLVAGLEATEPSASDDHVRGLSHALAMAGNLYDEERFVVLTKRVEDLLGIVTDPLLKADLTNALASTLNFTDLRRGEQMTQEAIELYREAGSPRWALAWSNRVSSLFVSADAALASELSAFSEEAAAAGIGTRMTPAYVDAYAAILADRPEEALTILEDTRRGLPEDLRVGTTFRMVEAYQALGDLDKAEETLARITHPGMRGKLASSIALMQASLHLDRGELDRVVPDLQPVMDQAARFELENVIRSFMTVAHARLAGLRGDFERTALLNGYWRRESENRGYGLKPHDRRQLAVAIKASEAALGADEVARLEAEGAALSWSDLPLYEA